MILRGIPVKSDSTVDLGKGILEQIVFTDDCDVMSEKIQD